MAVLEFYKKGQGSIARLLALVGSGMLLLWGCWAFWIYLEGVTELSRALITVPRIDMEIDFALIDQEGVFHQLSRYGHKQAVVLIGQSNNFRRCFRMNEEDCIGMFSANPFHILDSEEIMDITVAVPEFHVHAGALVDVIAKVLVRHKEDVTVIRETRAVEYAK